MNKRVFHPSLLSAACLLCLSTSANAAGFYLQEQSVSGLGTAFAGVQADTTDATTVYYNPAGMSELTQPEIYFGASLLVPHADFDNEGSTYTAPGGLGGATSLLTGTDSGNPFDPAVVPHIYGVLPVHPKLVLGIGVYAPFGLADQYDDSFVGRYNSINSELKTIDIQPSASYKFNDWFSVGGGVTIEYVYANLKNRIPAPSAGAPNPAVDGNQRLKGTDWSVGYNLGVLVKPTPATKVGLTYKSAITHDLEGQLDILRPTSALLGGLSGTFVSAPGQAELNLPDIASLAVAQQLNDKWTVLGSLNWYGWSNFESIPVTSSLIPGGFASTPQNYDNTWGFAVGAKYRLNDQWLLKTGFQFDQTPTISPDRSTRVPDGDRMWFAAGATYTITPQIDLDFSGAYVDVSSKKVAVTDTYTTGTTVTRGNSGGNVAILSTAIRYKF